MADRIARREEAAASSIGRVDSGQSRRACTSPPVAKYQSGGAPRGEDQATLTILARPRVVRM